MSTQPLSIRIDSAGGRPRRHDGPKAGAPAPSSSARPSLTPLTDIHEAPGGLLLEADLPGVTDETLQVEVTDLVLTLHARLDWAVPEGARVLYTESPGGDYHRAFILSDEVDRSQITAQLANGVLRLWLPRGDGRKSRRVEVKSV